MICRIKPRVKHTQMPSSASTKNHPNEKGAGEQLTREGCLTCLIQVALPRARVLSLSGSMDSRKPLSPTKARRSLRLGSGELPRQLAQGAGFPRPSPQSCNSLCARHRHREQDTRQQPRSRLPFTLKKLPRLSRLRVPMV